MSDENSPRDDSPDISEYEQKLATSIPLRERVIRTAFRALDLPEGSRGLDVGCGLGHLTGWLAELVGPTGCVTGVDVVPAFLERARKLAAAAGLDDRLKFREGSARELPFQRDDFDWVVSVDCVGNPAAGNPVALSRELARVVRPGGTVALLTWSSERLLPGHTALEMRLNASTHGSARTAEDQPPNLHFARALGWLGEAGLEKATGQSFVDSVQAPLDVALYEALISMLEMCWGEFVDEMSEDLRAEFEQLCTPGRPGFILDQPDYFAQFTYTMFTGRVAGA